MRWPLRNQILLPMTAVILAALFGVTLLNAYLSVSRAEAQIERQLRNVASTLSESRFPLTDAVLRQMRGLSGAEYVLSDRSGKVLAASDREHDADAGLLAGDVLDQPQIQLSRTVRLGDREFLHAAVPLMRGTGPNTSLLRLHIFYPESSYSEAWRQAAYPPLIVGAIGLALVVLLAAVISARVAVPLAQFREQVGRLPDGSFAPLPLPSRDDEVRDLAVAINRMAEMLSAYEEKIRRTEQLRTLGQLGGGIAHQLRNSITGCRMALDLHRRECPLDDADESLDVASRQLMLMDNFIRRLLIRTPSDSATRAPVELPSLVERMLPLLRPAAAHAHVELLVENEGEPAVVHGVDEDLEQLLINLVINAIDAAASDATAINSAAQPAGSRFVRVTTRTTADDRAILEVQNTGRGPDPRIQSRMFDPLVTTKPDGTGLGLSIVADIVQRHGGKISWQQQDRLTTFVVDVPKCDTGT
ncbi:MAG: GHKL domain-containing protein [Planctomycetia bacterium]|nr:GHKL domain-containing protein [Planctomycetia bacterium]